LFKQRPVAREARRRYGGIVRGIIGWFGAAPLLHDPRTRSSCRSQIALWFQLALFWSTILRSWLQAKDAHRSVALNATITKVLLVEAVAASLNGVISP